MKNPLEIILSLALLLSLLFLINYESDSVVFSAIKTVLVVCIIFFVPGYLLADLLFGKSLETAELLVLIIGLSIASVILCGLAASFSGLPISAQAVLNLVWFVISVLIIASFFKKDFEWTIVKNLKKRSSKKARKESKDKLFYLNLVLLFAVVCSMVYLSVSYPSKEEFVELEWKLSKMEDVVATRAAKCNLEKCSLSGVNKVGKAELNGAEYNVLLSDLNEPKKYDSICIDLNRNGIYCDEEGRREGPFWPSDNILIGDSAFSLDILNDGNILIFNFPKKVDSNNFTVSYVVKSHYSKTLDYDLVMTINQTEVSVKKIILEPNQETTVRESVVLHGRGVYKVEVLASPVDNLEKASISFWVTY